MATRRASFGHPLPRESDASSKGFVVPEVWSILTTVAPDRVYRQTPELVGRGSAVEGIRDGGRHGAPAVVFARTGTLNRIDMKVPHAFFDNAVRQPTADVSQCKTPKLHTHTKR